MRQLAFSLCGGRGLCGGYVEAVGRGFKLWEVCQTWVTSVFFHALSIWRAPPLIRVTVCCKLQHICSTFVAHGNFSKIMNAVKMKLRIWYLWSLIILPTKFHDAAATRSAAAICCSIFAAHLLQMAVSQKL